MCASRSLVEDHEKTDTMMCDVMGSTQPNSNRKSKLIAERSRKHETLLWRSKRHNVRHSQSQMINSNMSFKLKYHQERKTEHAESKSEYFTANSPPFEVEQ